ncbi:hypothetical protein H0H92_003197 [Tricholoma furcatifolium]|nr:hypothetical protein H0H92_003197 [Tricholoma furcatifolium]
MPRTASSCSIHFSFKLSVSSAASAIMQTAKKAFSSVKTALRPKKKAHVGKNNADEANNAGSESDKDDIVELSTYYFNH